MIESLDTKNIKEFHPVIRNAVRAVIVRNQQILMLRKGGDVLGERYSLPGGAQETGESLHNALNRECLEEIDTQVEICKLMHVADYFKYRTRESVPFRHQVEFFFSCQIAEDYIPRNGKFPDKHQLEVCWVPLADITEITLAPDFFRDILQGLHKGSRPIYTGAY